MTTLLALLPLLLVLGLLASGRVSALVAGLAGLSATLVASFIIVQQSRGSDVLGPLFVRETAAGAWLSWHVIAIIAAGMFFHRCLQARDGATDASPLAANPRRLWSVCFLLAPFGEAVTGFGIGYIIALTGLRRIGIGGLPALLLGLYSQSLVPWGALAIGTTVGATLAGMTPNQLGLGSAILQVPIHAFYLVLYWRFARDAGVSVSLAQKVDDAVWTILLLGLILLLNFYSDIEIAGAAATALLLAVRFWRDERPDQARLIGALKANAPYVALTVALCATRLVPPLRDLLKPLWALKPFDNQPAFAPFYAPGFWLVAIGLVVVWQARAPLGRVLAEAGRGAWRACLVTLLFVVMAEFYVGSGMADSIAEALRAAAGRGSAMSVPVFAAVGGFLTGGGAAANAMLMPMVTALARAIAVDPAWVAAVQNSICTNLTMLSPIRVSMGAAILALATPELGALSSRLAARAAAPAHRFRRHRDPADPLMTVTRRRFAAAALTLAAAPRPAEAVIVLDSTWRAEGGFRAHMALADEPQFASVIALSSDDGQVWGSGSGTWIGNVRGHARILTAAHVFNRGGAADDYVYRAPDGTAMQGTDIVFHPLYNWSNAERTGYDFAIVQLDGPIDDAGPPPALYGGNREDGARIVMVGWGSRGIGSVGQKPQYYTTPGKAAATNKVDEVMDAVRPVPKSGDAGNWLGVTLRHESEGAERLDGILGSGDSGGSAWISTAGGWAVCGVNANGNGDTYGSKSWFARVSGVRDWLTATVPGLRFVT